MFASFQHEELLVEEWQPAGGLKTLMSYGVGPRALVQAPSDAWVEAALRQVPASHHNFLVHLPNSHRIGDHYFAHAGVRPGIALDRQRPDDLLWIRNAFLGDRSDYGAVVVPGHTPTQEAELHYNRINLDTGAYITSRLACLRIVADGPQILEP